MTTSTLGASDSQLGNLGLAAGTLATDPPSTNPSGYEYVTSVNALVEALPDEAQVTSILAFVDARTAADIQVTTIQVFVDAILSLSVPASGASTSAGSAAARIPNTLRASGASTALGSARPLAQVLLTTDGESASGGYALLRLAVRLQASGASVSVGQTALDTPHLAKIFMTKGLSGSDGQARASRAFCLLADGISASLGSVRGRFIAQVEVRWKRPGASLAGHFGSQQLPASPVSGHMGAIRPHSSKTK